MERIEVLGLTMAYREVGDGDPIVFVHGNPTSSFLWRHVIDATASSGRCLAPDLIGMGDSAKLPDSGPGRYTFLEHAQYLDAFLSAVGVTDRVVLVGHDWGAVLATYWARRNADAVRGIAYLETLVAPVTGDGPNAPDPAFFGPLRSAEGDRLVLAENAFVELVLPAGTLRQLTDDELDAYRRPYLEPGESRRPMLTWAQQIPIDGQPAEVHDLVAANAAWMAGSDVPKLFVNGEPGALLTADLRHRCRRWPAQTEVTVRGSHFLPEDSPDEIAAALRHWIAGLA